MPMYAVGIDSGTQGTKALIIDFKTGRVLGRGYGPHALVEGLGPGASEQDPASWVGALETALAAALKQARIDAKKVVSLGVSGQQHGFVASRRQGPADPAGQALERHFDHRGNPGDRRRARRPRQDRSKGWASLWPSASRPRRFSGSRGTSPRNFERLATVLLPHNYLNFSLTGRAPHGIRRRFGHGAHGHPDARLGRGRRWTRSIRASPESCRRSVTRASRSGMMKKSVADRLRIGPGPRRERRRRQHDGRHRQRATSRPASAP